MATKLYELPRGGGAKIYNTRPVVEGIEIPAGVLRFMRMDGMYGICGVQDAEGDGIMDSYKMPAVVHLNASTELVPYKDGYVIDDFDHSDELRDERDAEREESDRAQAERHDDE